ncbi:16S rRNA processing protein RimM [bacterium]|nr:16S rRNA processing protein RimM [bacterium]
MTKYISVGKILNFHGIKGEVRVGYSQNRLDFFLTLNCVFIKENSQYKRLDIVSARPHKNFVIVKFAGLDDINQVIPYKGSILFVEEQTVRESLDENEFLIDEMVGLEVFDIETDKKLGFVIGVSNNGANDLLSVKTNTKHVCLIPFVEAIVPVVDMKNRQIKINNIEGLLE